jgi:hypothetical protein
VAAAGRSGGGVIVPCVGGHTFISYSNTDRTYVDQLAAYLQAAGVPVWYDKELAGGDGVEDHIQLQIDTCAAFVIVLPRRHRTPTG